MEKIPKTKTKRSSTRSVRKQTKTSEEHQKIKTLVQDFFDQAARVLARDPNKANELVADARRVAMKARIRLTREQKRLFCTHCYAYLVPGVNLRVPTRSGMVVYSCLCCKKFMRFSVP